MRDAQRNGIRHIFVIPCLFLTLMAGPVGLLLYFVLRWTIAKQLIIDETVTVDPVVVEA